MVADRNRGNNDLNLAGVTPSSQHCNLAPSRIQPCLMDDSGKEMLNNSVEGKLCKSHTINREINMEITKDLAYLFFNF